MAADFPLLPPPPSSAKTPPFREDCWSDDATSTLIDAWGRRYLELNRGNLRQKDWQEVADSVNAKHGFSLKTTRTDIQCKNRIDTLKKKYKAEKARVSPSYSSPWLFFPRLDLLIGSNNNIIKKNDEQKRQHQLVVLPQKRGIMEAEAVDGGYLRWNYPAVAAAAAAVEEEEDNEVEEEGGMRRLAKAIERFGEIYERVEGEKQRQMIELEKQRMQFFKDLEVQRMQLLLDTQVQLQKVKQSKRKF